MVSGRNRVTPVIPEGLRLWVLNREISAHFRTIRAFILGHALNVVVGAWVFAGSVAPVTLVIWAALALLGCAHRLWLWRAYRRSVWRENPERVYMQLLANTCGIASSFALAYLFLPSVATPAQFVFVAISFATRLGSAAINLRTLPRCAVAYISIVGTTSIMALLSQPAYATGAAALLVVVATVFSAHSSLAAHNDFIIRILRERELRQSSETVRLLLNDYEDRGTDWLFELSADGYVHRPSQRFLKALGPEGNGLSVRPFFDLFTPSPERDQIVDHLTHGRAFRNLVATLELDGQTHWWSISARPVTTGMGRSVAFRGVISDITAEREAQARARYMAHYDTLTGLPNRFRFNSRLEDIAANRALDEYFCLLLIDIDRFKAVNDTLGHPVGDQLLKAMGARIVDCLAASGLGGESCLFARLGGDEFGILMTGDGVVDHAIRLCDLLIDATNKPFIVGPHHISATLSIGLAIAPYDGDTGETLLRNADLALYCAKDEGRSRWERFEPHMDLAIQTRHALERDLRNALARNEFELYYQPLVDARTGLHTGFEALLRWNQSERGMVMPTDFIPLAEETGLIIPIGEWVIREAMAQAARWPSPLTIAVNLSPVQMRSPHLIPTLVNALAVSGLAPERFEIEITEGVLLHNTDENMAVLRRLHDLGIKIALDDFGTGYSSLNYLRTFPFDKIKIDRSFVRDLEDHRDCREIVSAVISLANNLGMATLAEGVEQEAQLDELRRGGCTMVQGWLFGKAMPASHYARLLDLDKLPRHAVN